MAQAIEIERAPRRWGRVSALRGPLITIEGLGPAARVGAQLVIARDGDDPMLAEIAGLANGEALCLPFTAAKGIAQGARADLIQKEAVIRPDRRWLGRVIDGLGRQIDGKGPLARGVHPRAIQAPPPPAHQRQRLGRRVDSGVGALDLFVPLCAGQRLGLFAGSGVGKSVLLSMLARGCDSDIAVIGLIGERGREVQEFLDDTLGPEGLARSVVVVATSDEPALMRRQAAWMTMAVAEHFRDEGRSVLCLMDSVTRFAMAVREIGLSAGEPPATKGYPPSVFAELPRLLERAGPGIAGAGTITGLFSVLVDGGDHDEPIADAVRGILDGHVVLSRKIAERGRYPAINLLKSVSRTAMRAHDASTAAVIAEAKALLSVWEDMAEMVRLGAYQAGTDTEADRAIRIGPMIEAAMRQAPAERRDLGATVAALTALMAPPE